MQRSAMILPSAIILACLAVTAHAADQATTSGYHEFIMTANNYAFDPSVITVKKGEKVRLFITAVDRDHGIKIQGYDIDQVLKKGSTATIEFTADKAGTFEFKCSVYCGHGHGKMKGKLIVEE
jgi:cytochrome c oxidase subunit 2